MNYIKIDKASICNGYGFRAVLWVTGCTIGCVGCHNRHLCDFKLGKKFDRATMDTLLDILSKPYIQGLTLSGGHPLELQNLDAVYDLITEVRAKLPNKDIWLYTGLTWEDAIQNEQRKQILYMCDVVVDGPFVEPKKDITLKFRGSSNQRLIDVKKTIQQNQITLLED